MLLKLNFFMTTRTTSKIRKKILEFVDFENTEKIMLFSDNDEDGLTSAIQLKKFLEKNGKETKIVFYDHRTGLGKDSKKFFQFKPEKIFFTDLADDFIRDIIKTLDSKKKFQTRFVSIDHHQRNGSLEKEYDCLVIKPDSISKKHASKYPASKMVNDIFGGDEWIALIGLIGDSSEKEWPSFFKKTLKKYSISEKKFYELTEIVTCIVSQHKNLLNDLLEFLSKEKEPKKLFKTVFAGLKKDFSKKVNKEIARFEKEKEHYPELKLSFFKTNHGFTSILSNILSSKNKREITIVYSIAGQFVNASIRNPLFEKNNIDCNDIARKSVKDFEKSAGGGHAPAAGARFPKKHLEDFKKNVLEYLKNKK